MLFVQYSGNSRKNRAVYVINSCYFVISVRQESTNVTNEDRSPMKAVTAVEPDMDTNCDSGQSPVPANDESLAQMEEKADKEPSVSPSDNDIKSSNSTLKETDANKEILPKHATEKTTSENTANKTATVSKSRPSRDKNGGSVTGGRVTSKSHITGSESGGNASGTSRKPAPNSQAGLAGNYILEPDPKVKTCVVAQQYTLVYIVFLSTVQK